MAPDAKWIGCRAFTGIYFLKFKDMARSKFE
jgi:hypothetical protein